MITVIGIGPGNRQLRLQGTEKYLTAADVVIGSTRQLATLNDVSAVKKPLPHLPQLKDYLRQHQEQEVVLLASGDPLLYGIGNWVARNFPADCVRIIPGISAIQYMFNRLHLSMNDCYLTSSHGRVPNFDFILQHSKVAMVTDQKLGPYQIAEEVRRRHQHRTIYVGERLSYPDERISKCDETSVKKREYEMNVVIITNA